MNATKATRQGTELPSALDDLDRWLTARWARRRGRALDEVMVAMSRAADYWVLWLAITGALWATGTPRGRRAAPRALTALAIASAAANGPIKLVVQRRRPARLRQADLRALRSSSFPSGHTAAAAGFATAVTREWPAAGVLVIPLAALVSLSRVYLGAHYPSDVLAGAAVGVAAGRAATPRARCSSR